VKKRIRGKMRTKRTRRRKGRRTAMTTETKTTLGRFKNNWTEYLLKK
jgi:hypothetical protein